MACVVIFLFSLLNSGFFVYMFFTFRAFNSTSFDVPSFSFCRARIYSTLQHKCSVLKLSLLNFIPFQGRCSSHGPLVGTLYWRRHKLWVRHKLKGFYTSGKNSSTDWDKTDKKKIPNANAFQTFMKFLFGTLKISGKKIVSMFSNLACSFRDHSFVLSLNVLHAFCTISF